MSRGGNETGQHLWDRPHDELVRMERVELLMLEEIGGLLAAISKGQRHIMATLDQITADLAQAQTDAAAVLAAVTPLAGQIADLQAQIAALVAGEVTQDQIDALDATAKTIDATEQATLAALNPAPAS